MFRIRVAALLGVLLASSGCAYVPTLDEVVPDKKKEYQKSESLPDLEVPPDLTTESIRDALPVPEVDHRGTATFSTYQERTDRLKTEGDAQRFVAPADTRTVSGDETLITVDGDPLEVWDSLRAFLRDRGYALELDDTELGVLQTGWLENRATQQRDKFKVRVEPGERSGSSLLHLSHLGEEVDPVSQGLRWRARPRDPDLESRMAAQLEGYLGRGGPSAMVAGPGPADTYSRAETLSAEHDSRAGAGTAREAAGRRAELLSVGEDKKFLRVREDFADAWLSTGLALDQAGIEVKDKNEGRGVYSVRYHLNGEAAAEREGGFWSRLAFWRGHGDHKYEVQLTGVGDKTEIVVLDEHGDWDASEAANRILGLLEGELNRY